MGISFFTVVSRALTEPALADGILTCTDRGINSCSCWLGTSLAEHQFWLAAQFLSRKCISHPLVRYQSTAPCVCHTESAAS